jgi:phosphoenolpyruvate carboxykinase (GTP)
MEVSEASLRVLLSVDPAAWQDEATSIGEYLTTFGDHLPGRLWYEHDALLRRLKAARQ